MISVGNTAQSCSALRRRSAWSMSRVGLKPWAAPTIEMAERTASITVWLDAASAGSRSTIESGTSRSGAISLGERGALGGGREVALEEQEPHVLEAELVGQLHGVVLAVVVEALEAADVADRRLGHDHALEPGRRLDGGRVHDGLDLGHAHEVAQRHDPDQCTVVHRDRQVAVAVVGRAR